MVFLATLSHKLDNEKKKIKESPPKTTKASHVEQDMQDIINAFSNVDFLIEATFLSKTVWLGMYKSVPTLDP